MIDPCIPAGWDGFEVNRKFRGADYRIVVRNTSHVSKGVKSITLNGNPVEGNEIAAQPAGTSNVVEVEM